MKMRYAKQKSLAQLQAATDKMPAPRKGVMYHFRSLETLCLYIQKHGLDVRGWRGDILTVGIPSDAGSMIEEAETLGAVREKVGA